MEETENLRKRKRQYSKELLQPPKGPGLCRSQEHKLGHTKLILCFTDCLGQKHDPIGRQKNKNKNDQTSHKFN